MQLTETILANIGNGGEALGKKEIANLAENSTSSTVSARKYTYKIRKIKAVQALEILRQGLLVYNNAGGVASIRPVHRKHAGKSVDIVLANVESCGIKLQAIGGENE